MSHSWGTWQRAAVQWCSPNENSNRSLLECADSHPFSFFFSCSFFSFFQHFTCNTPFFRIPIFINSPFSPLSPFFIYFYPACPLSQKLKQPPPLRKVMHQKCPKLMPCVLRLTRRRRLSKLQLPRDKYVVYCLYYFPPLPFIQVTSLPFIFFFLHLSYIPNFSSSALVLFFLFFLTFLHSCFALFIFLFFFIFFLSTLFYTFPLVFFSFFYFL